MSGLLASKWANAEPSQDPISLPVSSRSKPLAKSPSMPSAKPQAPAVKQQASLSNGLLRSKWATAPDDPPHASHADGPTSTTKPNSPTGPDKRSKKHSPRSLAPDVGRIAESLNRVDLGKPIQKHHDHHQHHERHQYHEHHHQNRQNQQHHQHHEHHQYHQNTRPHTHPGTRPKQNNHLPKSSRSHKGAPSSNQNGSKQLGRDLSTGEDERVPMTDAGSVLAARLGMPVQKERAMPSPNRSRTQATVSHSKLRADDAHRTYALSKQRRHQESVNSVESKEPEQSGESSQSETDAKLKAEVRSMFEKMSDKSTSWADLEDE